MNSTSLRSDVFDDTIEAAAAMLQQARTEAVPLPDTDPLLTLRVDGQGRCLVATIWGPDGATLHPNLAERIAPLHASLGWAAVERPTDA